MVAVAQLVRALVCGTGGRGFKLISPQPSASLVSDHFSKEMYLKLNLYQL